MSLEWTKRIVDFDVLEEVAQRHTEPVSMVEWLRDMECIPEGVNWKRGNRVPNTSLDRTNVTAGYLAEVAFDFDTEGIASPREFFDWLRFEVAGTPENDSMKRVLGEITQEATTSWSD